ncbi:hypothetical protein ACO0QE_000054 [Hanseniaspora vineae]
MFPFATTIPMIPSELFNAAPCYAPAPNEMRYYTTPVQPRHVVREPFQWRFEQGDEQTDRLVFTKNVSGSELRDNLEQYVAHQQSLARARYDPFFGRYYYTEENDLDLSKFGKALSTKQFRDFAFELNARGNELTVVKDNGEIAKIFELSNNYDDVAIEECDFIDNKAVLVLSLKKPVHKTTKKVKTLEAPALNGNTYLLHLQQLAAQEQEKLTKQQEEAKKAREQEIKLAQEKRQKDEETRRLKQEQERKAKKEEAERVRLAKQEEAKKEREQEIAKLLKEKLAKQQRLEAKKIEQRLKFEKEQQKLLARQKRMEIEQQRILAKQEELKKKYKTSLQNIDVDADGDVSLDEDSGKTNVAEESSPTIAAITVASVLSDLAKNDKETALDSDDGSVASTSSSTSSRKSSFKVEDIEDEEIAHYNSSLLNSPKSNAILEGI